MRLGKFSSSFVRAQVIYIELGKGRRVRACDACCIVPQVQLEGRLLVAIESILLPAQPRASRLYCTASIVEPSGTPFPLLEVQCTAVQSVDVGHTGLSFGDELALPLPRRILAAAGPHPSLQRPRIQSNQ